MTAAAALPGGIEFVDRPTPAVANATTFEFLADRGAGLADVDDEPTDQFRRRLEEHFRTPRRHLLEVFQIHMSGKDDRSKVITLESGFLRYVY